MQGSYDVHFVSSNDKKYSEARDILAEFSINLGFIRHTLVEIQSDSIGMIAREKARSAAARFGVPVLAEDDGLFLDGLGGFPGPYSSHALQTIGIPGVLRLLGHDRRARFVSAVSYSDGGGLHSFEAELPGMIAESARGDGWGYDPIFVPHDMCHTFAEMAQKNHISHRYLALKKFATWYCGMRESGGQ